MNTLHAQLPACPLEYEVPFIPGTHTALVIDTQPEHIDWQEKLLPWTLASLINNTDLIMKGVHLYVLCDNTTQPQIESALKHFDLPPDTILKRDTHVPSLTAVNWHYDAVCYLDIQYWAFRGYGEKSKTPDIKLPLGHVLKHNWGWGVADYSLHPANDTLLKSAWIGGYQPLKCTQPDSPASKRKLAKHLVNESERATWLHAANTAVYGNNYRKKNLNIANYFFNETEPNWHLDASILQFPSHQIQTPDFRAFTENYGHLGTDALIALWLLKTRQHAYNFKDSVMIDAENLFLAEYPRLYNMRYAPKAVYQDAIKQLMGAHINMAI